MKKTTKIISILLSAVMLICCFCTVGLAAEDTTKFVLIGDSIAAGTGVRNAEANAYGALVAQANGYEFENYAVPGHTSFALNNRLTNETVIAGLSDADIIGISIGGNNFLLGGLMQMISDVLLKNDYTKMDETAAEFKADFLLILDKLEAINPDAVLLVQTLYNPRTDFLRDAYQQAVNRLNAIFTDILAERPGAYTIVEAGAAINNNSDYIQGDVIHPNEAGHYMIATAYLETLNEMGLGEATKPEGSLEDYVQETFIDKLVNIIKKLINGLQEIIHKFFGIELLAA